MRKQIQRMNSREIRKVFSIMGEKPRVICQGRKPLEPSGNYSRLVAKICKFPLVGVAPPPPPPRSVGKAIWHLGAVAQVTSSLLLFVPQFPIRFYFSSLTLLAQTHTHIHTHSVMMLLCTRRLIQTCYPLCRRLPQ